jgi:hypothetical protein
MIKSALSLLNESDFYSEIWEVLEILGVEEVIEFFLL